MFVFQLLIQTSVVFGYDMNTVYGAAKTRKNICDLTHLTVNEKPFPYVIHNNFITNESYRQLCQSFPDCPPSTGPTGFSLYWGDKEYQRLLDNNSAWHDLFNTFHSQNFIDWCRDQFAEIWQQENCQIDLSKAHYVPYREDRIDKERTTLRKIEHDAHELWVRMDVHQGRKGYARRVHVDHARRLISMLIYLSDNRENQITGGELFLHSGQPQQAHEHAPLCITPQHNLMVAFPCMRRSFHSVSEITSMNSPRNYIQVQISSSVDIWSPFKIDSKPRQWSKVWKYFTTS